MLPLILVPNPILRAKAQEISLPLSPEIKQLASEMFLAMQHYKGVGLAAPQINQSIRLIVIDTSNGPQAFINPEIKKHSIFTNNSEEGCLSIPGVFGVVKRYNKVLASYFNLNGEKEEVWLEDFIARVYQHEVDHLNGVLFTDHTTNIIAGKEIMSNYGL